MLGPTLVGPIVLLNLLGLLSYEMGSSVLLLVMDGKNGRTGSRPIIRTNGLNPVEALDAVLYAYSTNGRFPSQSMSFCSV